MDQWIPIAISGFALLHSIWRGVRRPTILAFVRGDTLVIENVGEGKALNVRVSTKEEVKALEHQLPATWRYLPARQWRAIPLNYSMADKRGKFSISVTYRRWRYGKNRTDRHTINPREHNAEHYNRGSELEDALIRFVADRLPREVRRRGYR